MPDYKGWSADEFTDPAGLNNYISALKRPLIGKRLDKVFILHPETGNTPVSARFRESLHISGPAALPFVLQFSGTQLGFWFAANHADKGVGKIGQNVGQLNSFSGFSLKDFSRFFRSGIIGAKLKDILVRTNLTYPCLDHLERYKHCSSNYYDEETVEEIIFVFRNGQRLLLAERAAAERGLAQPPFKPTDCRIIAGEPPLRRDGTFISFEGGKTIDEKHMWRPLKEEAAILIWADDLFSFFTIMPLEFPKFDEYEHFVIKKAVWLKVMEDWEFICNANDFEPVLELFKAKAKADKKNADRILWKAEHCAKQAWELRHTDRPLFENLKAWLDLQFKTHDHISVRGY